MREPRALELSRTPVSLAACHGTREALDALEATTSIPERLDALRIAPDELLVVGEPGAAEDLVAALGARLSALDPGGLCVDATDGWTVWTLTGEAWPEAFAMLSTVRLQDAGFAQGQVADVPAKVSARSGRVHLLVPSSVEEHVRRRILTACAGLGLREGSPSGWTPVPRGARP